MGAEERGDEVASGSAVPLVTRGTVNGHAHSEPPEPVHCRASSVPAMLPDFLL
jgi:hypothetical protein